MFKKFFGFIKEHFTVKASEWTHPYAHCAVYGGFTLGYLIFAIKSHASDVVKSAIFWLDMALGLWHIFKK